MAIFHLSVRTISRSAGRSAVAAAAYRAGARLRCDRTGRTFDYTRRHGVVATRVVVPRSETTVSRQQLWDHAEAAETRRNSTVAREIEIALPSELDARAREALALGFAATLADRYGIAVDVAIHDPSQTGDQRNHHAHLLTSTRVWEPDGTFGRKARQLDDRRTGPAEIVAMRALWAEMANAALTAAAVTSTIDHRSHLARGIADEPGSKLGPAAVGFERRTGEVSRRRADQEAERAAHEQDAASMRGAAENIDARERGPDRRQLHSQILRRLRSRFAAATAATMIGRAHSALGSVLPSAAPQRAPRSATASRRSAARGSSPAMSVRPPPVAPGTPATPARTRKRKDHDEAAEAAAMVRRVERDLEAEHMAQVAERVTAAKRVASIIDRERFRNAAGIVFARPSALSGAGSRTHSGPVATDPTRRPTVDESFDRPTGDRHDVESAPEVAAVPASGSTTDHGPELRHLAVMAAQELARRHKLSRARLRRLAEATDLDEKAFAAAVTAQDGKPFDPAAVAGSPVLAPLWDAWMEEDRAKQRKQQGGMADGSAGTVAEPAPLAHTPAEAGSDRASPADSPEAVGVEATATPARPYGRRDVVIDFAITLIARGGWSKDVGDALAGLLRTRREWVWREAHRVCRMRFGTERPDQVPKERLGAIGRAAFAGAQADLRVRRTLHAIASGQIGRGLG